MATRQEIAERLVFGIGGWFQMLACQSLHTQAGEDSARVQATQILNAQNSYVPETSALPQNWGTTKRRIDIALKGRTPNAHGWYGAVEIKWPGTAFDAHLTRTTIVEDAMRLSFIRTTNLSANLMVIGGSASAIHALFDAPHPNSQEREDRRNALNVLFSRDTANPDGVLLYSELSAFFPTFGSRVPAGVFNDFDGRLKTSLLAKCNVMLGADVVGVVSAWQCKRTRGTAQN